MQKKNEAKTDFVTLSKSVQRDGPLTVDLTITTTKDRMVIKGGNKIITLNCKCQNELGIYLEEVRLVPIKLEPSQ